MKKAPAAHGAEAYATRGRGNGEFAPSPTTSEGSKERPIRPAACRRGHAPRHYGRHQHHRPSVSSPSTSSAALPENPNPNPHHLTAGAPPEPVASPSRAPCRLAPQVREPAGYPNPSILGSALEEHWGRERGGHQPS